MGGWILLPSAHWVHSWYTLQLGVKTSCDVFLKQDLWGKCIWQQRKSPTSLFHNTHVSAQCSPSRDVHYAKEEWILNPSFLLAANGPIWCASNKALQSKKEGRIKDPYFFTVQNDSSELWHYVYCCRETFRNKPSRRKYILRYVTTCHKQFWVVKNTFQ